MTTFLVAYDIPDQRRRTRLAKALLDFGPRVQYSVFECPMPSSLLPRLVERIEAITDPDEDQIRVYRLCADCERSILFFGPSDPVRVDEVIVF